MSAALICLTHFDMFLRRTSASLFAPVPLVDPVAAGAPTRSGGPAGVPDPEELFQTVSGSNESLRALTDTSYAVPFSSEASTTLSQ